MGIAFTKMSGSGNEFLIIDNREPVISDGQKREFVRKVCAQKTSVGADGVIFIENSEESDFKWDFYNSDGSSAEMCGNGGRCVARYAYEHKIAPRTMTFETTAGIIAAVVDGANIRVKLTSPQDLRKGIDVELNGVRYSIDSLNTGVPHAIIYADDVAGVDVCGVGRGIRFHQSFAPAGTNVDFVQKIGDDSLKIRTYERGVEGETLACGTGVVASALLAFEKGLVDAPVNVETLGGETLKVDFQNSNGTYGDVFLEGLTRVSFEGNIVEL